MDPWGYALYGSEDQYLGDNCLQHGAHLHVKGGIGILGNYVGFSDYQANILHAHFNIRPKIKPARMARIREEIQRDESLVRRIKSIYSNCCQICGLSIRIGPDKFFSNVHHIWPLGKPFDGPDCLENLICVCPNHHAQLDYHSIELSPKDLILDKHAIGKKFIEHHNIIFRKLNELDDKIKRGKNDTS